MLTIQIATAYNFVNPVPITRAALRKAIAGITVTLSGSVGNSDLADSAVTPAKVVPGAYWHDHAATYDGGTSTYSVTISPILGALGSGVRVSFKVPSTCGAGANVSVCSLAAKAILRQDGSALQPGDIRAGQIAELRYDAAAASGSGAWLLVSPPARELSNVLTLGGAISSGLCAAYTVTPAVQPATLAEAAGQVYTFKAHAANASTATLALGTLAAKGLVSHGGFAVEQSRWIADEYIEVVYDATLDKWVLVSRPGTNYFVGEDAGSTDGYALNVPGFPTAPVNGMSVCFKAHTTNTGVCTLSVNGSTPAPIITHTGAAPITGAIGTDRWVTVVYDGTSWQIVGVNSFASSSLLSVPSSGTAAKFAHGLSSKPRYTRWIITNISGGAIANWNPGDEIEIHPIGNSVGGPNFSPYVDDTYIGTQFNSASGVYIFNKTTGAATDISGALGNWNLKCYYAA